MTNVPRLPPTPADHAATERRAFAESMFKADACERIAASNRQYQDTHGYYLPTLAWLLNETRNERDALAARADELERYCESQDWHTEWYVPMRQRAERAEAALREAIWLIGAGHPHTTEWHDRADAWYAIVRAALGEQP